MSHTLVEIPLEDWKKLRDLYNEHRTMTCAYGLLHSMIQWKDKEPQLDVKIFSLDGVWEIDGTFVVVLKDLAFPHIFFNTLSENLERLTTALNCLDTQSRYMFFAFPERLIPAARDHVIYAGMDVKEFDPEPTPWYYIEKEKALQFQIDVPSDFTISKLEVQKAEQINSIWPHRHPGSIEFVRLLIRLNDSAGIFDKAGNLIAWCLRLPVAGLGLLHVIDSHKRRGFGSLLVRYMSKAIASKNEEVMAPVVETNVASRSMFEKLGFTAIDNAYWQLKP